MIENESMIINHDFAIEECVLGNIINDHTKVYKLNEYPKTIFYATRNQELFEIMREIIKDRKTIDIQLLGHYISQNKPKDITITYIADLVGQGISSQFVHYTDILIDLYQKRIMAKSLMGIDFTKNSLEIKGEVLAALNTLKTKEEELNTCDLVMDTINNVLSGETKKGIQTGYKRIDENLLGFNPGELITISARSGIGKTTFALNTFTHQVMRGYKPQYFSLEMPKEEIIKKMLALQGNISNQKLRKNQVTESEEQDQLIFLGNKLASKQFKIYDNNCTLEWIESKIREEHINGNIDIAYIDLVNRVTHNMKNGSRAEYVGHITRTFKQLALELKIPIVILAQINRTAEQRGDKRPLLSDLKESGSIEEDSDVVISLYRNLKVCDKNYDGQKDYSSDNPDKNPERVEIEILKSRYFGNMLTCMKYDADYGRISELMR